MNLNYENIIEESTFNVTDFNCAQGQKLLERKGSYKIIWAKDNDINMIIDGYNFMLRKNQVIFGTPINIFEIPIEQAGILSLVFNREFYCIRDNDFEVSCESVLFFGSAGPSIIDLNEKEIKSFTIIYSILMEEFDIQDHIQGEMLRVLLKRMLIKSRRLATSSISYSYIPEGEIEDLRRFNVLVEKYFKQKHKVLDYAHLLKISPKKLSLIVKKYHGKPAVVYIHERILLESKRLLLYSDKTSLEIAYELGFKTSAHYSNFFKKHTGLRPIQFKKTGKIQ
jgi:AraC-like DNA-binding protein